ncbi:hypothetical protein [Streptomyces sp. RP5T]|uniref:hypothetical protein n=1 Tax=Streptomyces sp. RP5T TaxID=2490848 RepID=UPI00163AA9AF|nr:hypothetical protein [Streptomyces sp. RP5T]
MRDRALSNGQAVAYPAWITRVRYLGQLPEKAWDFLGYDLGVLAQLVKGRWGQR